MQLNTRTLVFNLLFMLTLLVLAFQAKAADKGAAFAVIDGQAIQEKSIAIQKINEQVDKKNEEFNKEYKQKEEYFKKKFAELEKQKTVLSKEAQEKQTDDLSKEYNETIRKLQESHKAIDKAKFDAWQQVVKTLNDVVKDEATKSEIKIVLYKEQSIYADSNLDITSKILDALNKKLPNVTVKFS